VNLSAGRRGVLAASGSAVLLLAFAFVPVGGDPSPQHVVPVPAPPPILIETAMPGSEIIMPARFQPVATVGKDAPRIKSSRRGVSILQIGDSHTAADFFTDAARQALRRKFGVGGIGYMSVGTPHPGVRSNLLRVSASPGWTYEAIQRFPHPEVFGLSGFNASTSRQGETLTFSASSLEPYARIEIEVRTEPEGGTIVVEVDDEVRLTTALASTTPGSRMIKILAPAGESTFRKLVLRTGEAKPVTVSAVGIYRDVRGVTYSNVGFPGATVDVVGKLAEGALRNDLGRLSPDIVVLAFGTNEGFDAKLDPAAYQERYRSAVREIRTSVPKARLVMIGPPQGERPLPTCKPEEGKPCPAPGMEKQTAAEGENACPKRPAQLDKVREVQRRIADAERLPFWDWWAIMPGGCGASRWAAADPPLMAKDHVHFTKAGYRRGGESFAAFLEPEIKAMLRGEDAVSND